MSKRAVLADEIQIILAVTRGKRELEGPGLELDANAAIVDTILRPAIYKGIARSQVIFDTVVPLLDKQPWTKEHRAYINARLELLAAPDRAARFPNLEDRFDDT